ncbi:MAG TPA: HDOD domain-containing protein [Phycisphaerae bacterium]|nr:HDOD domain-containing protein [Phycisphaerae bacterium]
MSEAPRPGGTSQLEDGPWGTAAAADPHKVEQILSQLDELPPPRVGGLRTADAGRLANSIVADAPLLAEMRAIQALPAFDPRPARVFVGEWIALHGVEGVRALALALKILDNLETGCGDRRGRLDQAEFRRHGLAVACGAAQISQALEMPVASLEMFAAGLVHDIGKAALDAALPKSYVRVLRRFEATGADFADVEQAVLGIDHLAAGRHLAQRWGLPERVAECIWLHHHLPESLPAAVAVGRHVQIVQLADTLARERRIGFSGTPTIARSSQLLAIQLGLSEEKRNTIADALLSEVSARAGWLSPRPKTDPVSSALVASVRDKSVRLMEENRRLKTDLRYFTAVDRFNQSLSATASVREVCAAGAGAIQRACRTSLHEVRAVVFVVSANGQWVDVGWAEGQTRSAVYQRSVDAAGGTSSATPEAQHAEAGAGLLAVPGDFADVIDRARGALGNGTVRLLPILHDNRWVGGALLTGTDDAMTALERQITGLSALAHAVGLALARAGEYAAGRRLADELAAAQRRAAALEPHRIRNSTLDTVLAMAAGAAHDLNNPLAVISGRAQLLHSRITNEPVRAVLKEIAGQAQSASNIVTELMDFARPCTPVPESINPAEFFETLRTELAAAGLLDGRDLSLEVAPSTPPVWFDRTQLSHLFRELIANSVEATTPDGGRLTVKAAPDLAEEHVVMRVSDNGRGMTADVLGRAMDPFFSHRPAGRGRGLGLARVQRWVAAGQAAIQIDSQPGQGTTVTLRLPVPPVQTK